MNLSDRRLQIDINRYRRLTKSNLLSIQSIYYRIRHKSVYLVQRLKGSIQFFGHNSDTITV